MGAERRNRVKPVSRGLRTAPSVARRSGDDAGTPIRRPRLEARLDDWAGRRLVTVVAGPGSGKSSLLRGWSEGRRHAWHTVTERDRALAILASGLVAQIEASLAHPLAETSALDAAVSSGQVDDTPERADALAAFICSLLDGQLDQDLHLIVDDLHELGSSMAPARLIAGLCRNAPQRLHLVFASREEMPFQIERLAAHGDVGQLDGRDLALDNLEIDQLLEASGIQPATEFTQTLADATNGWPAAVRLAIESFRSQGGAESSINELRNPQGPLFGYLANEVFERESSTVRDLIRTVAPLERFSSELCSALGIADAPAAIRSLSARGLFLDRIGDDFVLHGLVRDFAQRAWPLNERETARILAGASAWYAANGKPDTAIGLAVRAADWAAVEGLLLRFGSRLIRSGGGIAVTQAAERIPAALRSAAVARVAGEAFATLGQSDQALEWLDRATPSEGHVPVEISWRRAMSHYLRDELQEVVAIHESTELDGAPATDAAMLAAWSAGAYRRLGNTDKARILAEQALTAAAMSDDDSVRAAAHTAGAFAAEIEGDRVGSERHLRLALAAAERAGDLLQTVRIRINRGSDLLESGQYIESIDDFDAAISVASLAGFVSLRALALMNRGLANWCLGRLEAASGDYAESSDAYSAAGSRELAYAVIGRGDVYRERGDLELARVQYEEGLALSERTGDRQALVPALYQSAKVIVGERPEEAVARAERAVEYGWPDRAWALVALGWIALMTGDEARARQAAADAADAARVARDRFGSAEALELSAWTTNSVASRRELLEQAASIWRELGNPLREATSQLAIARTTSGPHARAAADAAERRLLRLGIRPSPFGAAGLLTAVAQAPTDAVEVRTLGGFRVLRDARPVVLSEWQSRKARDLLKVLVTRRGRPVPREILAEALWPDEPDAVTGNRLSVALSMLRLVLDPQKRFDPEHFVASDKENVSVDLNAVSVDVEIFLADAAAGLDQLRRGHLEEALDRLSAAEAAYTGDFLEEHPYDEWSVGLREEARATYIAVARALAGMARGAGDNEREVRLLLRTLERDPFDESSALALVSAYERQGSHGESRAAYLRYTQRMDEIDVEAVPFPVSRA